MSSKNESVSFKVESILPDKRYLESFGKQVDFSFSVSPGGISGIKVIPFRTGTIYQLMVRRKEQGRTTGGNKTLTVVLQCHNHPFHR